MSPANCLLTALRGITANRLRAGLTALGVVIGAASVIVMLALGNGARAAVDANFSYLGADTILVAAKDTLVDGAVQPLGQPLVYEDGLAMRAELDLVRLVDMSVTAGARLRFGRSLIYLSVLGATPDGFEQYVHSASVQPVGWPEGQPLSSADFIARGRFFTQAEAAQGARVCVLGSGASADLFQGENPLGQYVRAGRGLCLVIGELVALEMVDPAMRFQANPNDTFNMPISSVVMDFYEEPPSLTISVHVKDASQMDAARRAITDLLRERHAIQRDSNGVHQDDFTLTTRKDLLGAQEEAARTFSILLAAMAVVSLVVGGIGIVNVMLVSVSERTNEIGVRLAVGAQPRDIVLQFLLEAVLLSAGGGLIGLALGIFLVPLAASLNQGVALLDPASLPLAFGVALLTGVVFGLYPAARAARLDPIDALRHE